MVKKKVKVVEKEGVDLEYSEEVGYIASEMEFDPAGSPFDPSVITIRDALIAGYSPPIETLTEFESFSSPIEESTTSDTPITKSGYPFTTQIKTSGIYAVDYTALVANSSNNRDSRLIVDWRLGTSGPWATLMDLTKEFGKGNAFEPWTSFVEIEIPTVTNFQVRVQYASSGPGTCKIRQANIRIGKVTN